MVFLCINQTEDGEYGVDWEGPLPASSPECAIIVPTTECPLNDEMAEQLRGRIDPLSPSNVFGADIYSQCVNLVINLVQDSSN